MLFVSGDSGGPLMIHSNDSQPYELVGITSFRNACTTEGLFTRIEPFANWVLDIVENPPAITLFPPLTNFTTPIPLTPKPDVLGKMKDCKRQYVFSFL
jgi:secreted trypsin-like serine protease